MTNRDQACSAGAHGHRGAGTGEFGAVGVTHRSPWDDAHVLGVVDHALHGVGLAGASLAVRKHGRLEPFQNVPCEPNPTGMASARCGWSRGGGQVHRRERTDDRREGGVEDLFLGGERPEDRVDLEGAPGRTRPDPSDHVDGRGASRRADDLQGKWSDRSRALCSSLDVGTCRRAGEQRTGSVPSRFSFWLSGRSRTATWMPQEGILDVMAGGGGAT